MEVWILETIHDEGLCCSFSCKRRRGPGAMTAETCAGLHGRDSPLSAARSRLSRGACSIGSPSRGQAEASARWLGHDSFSLDVAGERSRALRRRKSETAAGPVTVRSAGSASPAAACDAAGSSSLLLAPEARWPPPPSSRRKCSAETCGGLRDPRPAAAPRGSYL